MDPDLPYFLGFSAFPGIGPYRFARLYEYFGSAKAAWESSVDELRRIRLGDALAERFDGFRKRTDLRMFVASLHAEHIGVVTVRDRQYPPLLKEISDAPFVLYVRGKRGERPIDLSKTVAVVGTRTVSRYGAEITERITRELVEAGCTIVSGMAYGVDAIAHRTALDAGGATIAVLGCGVDVIAPRSNEALYWDIIRSGRGAVISEMPPGLRPDRGLFPARNRIISGLSRGIVVTEGAEDSGALITASRAAEQGRDVFAVPGAITNPMSRGPAKLLKNGAKLVESARDILTELEFTSVASPFADTQAAFRGTNEEAAVYRIVSGDRKHIDAIVRESGLTAGVVAGILTILELRGVVKDYGDKIYGIA